MMRKVVIGFLAGGLALGLGAILYAGHEAQAHYRSTLAAVPEHPSYSLHGEAYQRGFLTSTAVTIVELNVPPSLVNGAAQRQAGVKEPARIMLRHDIEHFPRFWGSHPGLFVMETRLDTRDPGQRALVESLGIPEPFQVTTWTDLKGTTHALIKIAAFQHQKQGTGRGIDWRGLEGTVEATPGFAALDLSLHSPGFRAKGKDGEVRLGEFSMQSDLRRGPHNLWLGAQSLALSGMHLSGLAEPSGQTAQFSMGPLQLSAETRATGDRLAWAGRMTLKDIRFNGELIPSLRLASSVNNLKLAPIVAMRDQIQAIQHQAMPLEHQLAALDRVVLQHSSALLSGQPVLRIDELKVETPQGAIAASLELTATGVLPEAVRNPMTLLSAVRGSARLEVAQALVHTLAAEFARSQAKAGHTQSGQAMPAKDELNHAVTEQVEQQLLQLEAQGLLRRQDDRYTVQVEIGDKDLRINGRSLVGMLSADQGAVPFAP
jgi:uncharacterized protein YdgA (DUF945 family)